MNIRENQKHLGDMFFSTEITINTNEAEEIEITEKITQLSKQFNCPYLGQGKFIFWKKNKDPVCIIPAAQAEKGRVIELNDGYKLVNWVLEKNKKHNFIKRYPLAEALCIAEELGKFICDNNISGKSFEILVNDVVWYNEPSFKGLNGKYSEYSLLVEYSQISGLSLRGLEQGSTDRSAFSRFLMCKSYDC